LKDSNIESKLITGDNLYIGVETAMRVGIINEDEKIVVIEGRNQG
jgi:magnesium-transporting ATPase (P-type)